MATDFMTDMAQTALELVAEMGRTVTVTKLDTAPADAGEPYMGPLDPRGSGKTTQTVRACFVDPQSLTDLGISIPDPDLLKKCQEAMIVAPGPAFSEDLTTYHEVTDEGKRLRIYAAEKLRPATVTLCYFLWVGR